jgi:glutathionylspermidine synthase
MSDLVRRVSDEFREILGELDTPEHPAAEILRSVNEEFHRRGCVIKTAQGLTPFPVFIKPYFVTREQMNEIARVSNHIMNVLEKFTDLYFLDDRFKPMFNLTDKETELVRHETGTKRKIWITRNDAFMANDLSYLKFIEFNTDSPGGPMYSDVQTALIETTPVMERLRQKYYFSSDRFVPQILYNLLRAYREWGGKKERPNIAIVSDKGATYPEFLLIVEDFKRQGYNSAFSTPEEVTYDGKRAYTPDGMPIDILYRRGWIRNWTDVYDEIKPLRRAYADGAICVVNSIRSILGTIKSILEQLRDPEIMKIYTPEEREVVLNHVPWTRLLTERRTVGPDGEEEIDLFEYVARNRESLVIKPMDLYGGKGVVVGPASTQARWEETLQAAATGDQKYVVQTYVPIPEEELPEIDEQVTWRPKKMNQNFYAFGGLHAGGMCRTSEAPVINISAGGGLCPIVIIEGEK